MPELNISESFEAIRRADGDPIDDEYSWVSFDGGDWSERDEIHVDDEEPTVYERVRMHVEVIEQHTCNPMPACDRYEGELVTRSWVAVVLPTDGTDETWPARDHTVRVLDSQEEAVRFIDGLPEVFVPLEGIGPAGEVREVHRWELTIQGEEISSPSSCSTCGRPKRAHSA